MKERDEEKKLTDMHVIIACFGDSDPLRAAYGNDPMGNEEVVHPVTKAFDRAGFNHAMDKTKAASIDGWDEEVGDVTPAPKPANNFVKSSEARFAKVCEKLKRIFGEGEDYENAVKMAKQIRDEAVAEIVASF
jgi:hypothetical protein